MRRSTLLAALLAACASTSHEAPAPKSAAGGFVTPSREELALRLEEARAASEADLEDQEALIWYGRTLAYLGRYEDALDVYTQGLARWPDSPELLRHRGHRWITLRRFDLAEADLARASTLVRGRPDVVERDGMPNRYGIPRSTLAFNVEYHLALARYLLGDFDGSLEAWQRCLERARANDDMQVAAGHWTYLTLRRLERDEEAALLALSLAGAWEILENEAYSDSLRAARGEIEPEELCVSAPGEDLSAAVDDASRAYATACHLAFASRTEESRALLVALVERQGGGPAFGTIAAEVELARRWP